jgi:hypothetical protein
VLLLPIHQERAMKCKWCAYLATESLKRDGKPREKFDDLKIHAAREHPVEYREFSRQSWNATMTTGRRVQAIRRTERRALDSEESTYLRDRGFTGGED